MNTRDTSTGVQPCRPRCENPHGSTHRRVSPSTSTSTAARTSAFPQSRDGRVRPTLPADRAACRSTVSSRHPCLTTTPQHRDHRPRLQPELPLIQHQRHRLEEPLQRVPIDHHLRTLNRVPNHAADPYAVSIRPDRREREAGSGQFDCRTNIGVEYRTVSPTPR